VRADANGEELASETLRDGGVVVLPTDTVYGLAARPSDTEAVQEIFRVKGRPAGMPLPVLAASVGQVRALGVAFTPAAEVLARQWWPGPLTLAFGFDASRQRPRWLDGRDEVAVRVPDHEFLRGVLARTGVLVATSANPHGAPTPRTAADVAVGVGVGGKVDLVVDGGTLHDVPSTLVNVHGANAVVEREGAIPRSAVERSLAESP
jgi:L-threonylcarbamoyladenylate synthase